MHLAGEKDALVKFSWQQRMMEAVRSLNGCVSEGTAWDERCTLYASSSRTPLITFIHPGGHAYDPAATPKMVRFFKEHGAPGP
jgi:polyhydroxybutyrate depolymerase